MIKTDTLWPALFFTVGLLIIALQSFIVLRLPQPSAASPEDVKALLESGTVVVVVPDRWTGTDHGEYAEIVEIRLKKLEDKSPVIQPD